MNFISRKSHQKKAPNFFDLPSGERKKIVKEAGIAAQKDQEKLLREYAMRFEATG